MMEVALVPTAGLVLLVLLLVLLLVVGALLWALISARRSGVLAVLVVLAVLIGIPVLMVGAWFVAYERVGVTQHAVLVAHESASAIDAQAMSTEIGESAESKPQIPEWVDRKPQRSRDGSVMQTLTGRRYATPQQALDDALRQAAEEARNYLQQAAPRPVQWKVPLSFVQDRLVQDQFVSQVDWDAEGVDSPPFAEPMYQAHVLVELTPAKRDALLRMWREEVLGERIRWLAAGSAFVLVLLATLAGYLRLDEATRGYYSGRLKLVAVVVVGVAALVLLRLA
jgi:hypothetical protein